MHWTALKYLSEFSDYQIFELISSLCLIFFSAWLALHKKENSGLLMLIIGAFILRLLIISIDPYLNEWDERFHALVGKNMMGHPFLPLLFPNPIMPFDYTAWYSNFVWLHKQPLFLWQMALSMKIFGVNETALRLPSAFMGAIQLYFIFRIGEILFNKRVGYFSSFFLSLSYYQLELTSGRISTDHCDVAFCFYVAGSLWAFAEYYRKPKVIWVLLIGIFAGGAVLIKWLAGLLVFIGWGMNILSNKKFDQLFSKEIKNMFLSLIVAVTIFLPWQIYCAKVFPKEYQFEMTFNTEHLSNIVEHHSGDIFYYFGHFPDQYGYIGLLLLLIGIYYIIKKLRNVTLAAILIVDMFALYLFFTMVQTKMQSYVFIASPIVFLIFGVAMYFLIEEINGKMQNKNIRNSILTIFIIAISGFSQLRLGSILNNHYELVTENCNDGSNCRLRKIHNTEIYRQLDLLVPKGYVVFNCTPFENIEAMFYSDRVVYSGYMNEKQFVNLKDKGIKIAAFENHGIYDLPDFLVHDPQVLVIKKELE